MSLDKLNKFFLQERDNLGWVCLLFFQILGSFVLILFLWQLYSIWPCITHMHIYHLLGVFLAGYGWFEGNVLYFNTKIRLYHILFTDETTVYVAAEDFDGTDLFLL